MSSDSVFSAEDGSWTAHKDERRVQVLVVLIRIISVEFSRLPSVDGKKVGTGIIGPQRLKELFEGRMEAVSRVRNAPGGSYSVSNQRTTSGPVGPGSVLVLAVPFDFPLEVEAGFLPSPEVAETRQKKKVRVMLCGPLERRRQAPNRSRPGGGRGTLLPPTTRTITRPPQSRVQRLLDAGNHWAST